MRSLAITANDTVFVPVTAYTLPAAAVRDLNRMPHLPVAPTVLLGAMRVVPRGNETRWGMSPRGRRLPPRDDLLHASGGARPGGAAQRAWPDPAGGDAEHRAGRHRLHDPGDRGPVGRVATSAASRQFPWLFSVYLLAQAVSVPIYGKLADLYGRKPMMLVGVGPLPGRLAAVRLGVEHDRADRLPAGAGPRCRRDAADRDDDRRRHLHARGAGQGAGLPGQRLGDRRRDRADPRRRLRRLPRRGGGSSSSTCRSARRRCGCSGAGSRSRSSAGRHRIDYLGADAARPRRHAAAARLCSRAASSGGGARRPASGCSRPPWCCSARSCWWRPERPSRCCRCGSSGMRVLNVSPTLSCAGRRRADCWGCRRTCRCSRRRCWARCAGGRTRPGGDDDRLADRGRDLGPALPDASASGPRS